ncbi:MAG: DUF3307 domain-containing protein [Candidatus Omnitrophica bacterium]|nr:DUF3307 domain-containing protein [Candidatus Omnitrophota bacterium]
MFIFIRLLLGHLIGDFPLQFNKIYNLKHRGLIGIIPHALIVMSCFILLTLPYLNLPGLWGFIFFLSITHLFQDSIKIGYKGIRYRLLFYLLDQVSHVGLVSLVFVTNIKNIKPIQKAGLIWSLYNNDLLAIYIIAIIIATYNGYFMMRNLKNNLLGRGHIYSGFEKWYGMFERAILVSIFLLDKYIFLFISGVLILRPIIFILGRKRFMLNQEFISGSETLLSWLIGIVTGLFLCFVKHRIS